MGDKIGQTLMGGSSQSSTSKNVAFPWLKDALGGIVNTGGGANSQIAAMLGLGGPEAQNTGFENWKNSTGYQFGMNQGMGAVTGGAASKGLLNSGGTLQALTKFGQDYASTKNNEYLTSLQGLVGNGLNAAGTVGNAGQVSNSSGSSSKGAGGFIGSLMGKG